MKRSGTVVVVALLALAILSGCGGATAAPSAVPLTQPSTSVALTTSTAEPTSTTLTAGELALKLCAGTPDAMAAFFLTGVNGQIAQGESPIVIGQWLAGWEERFYRACPLVDNPAGMLAFKALKAQGNAERIIEVEAVTMARDMVSESGT